MTSPVSRVGRVSRVSRVSWLPGSDLLVGVCHCGARIEGTDPSSVWDWLAAHPAHSRDLPAPPASESFSPPAHLVSRPASIGRRAVPSA